MKAASSMCSCRHLASKDAVPGSWSSMSATTTTLRKVALEHFRYVLRHSRGADRGVGRSENETGESQGNYMHEKMLANSCGDCLTEMSSPELRSLDAVMGADEDVVICLQCLHVGCRRRRHLERHFLESSHFLGMHVAAGEIFCFHCGDFVYDVEFELARRLRSLLPEHQTENGHHGDQLAPHCFTWEHLSSPSLAYAALGLRGLYNLGNTCFMNSVLQALLHNPLLQRFFLARSHSPAACAKAKAMLHPPALGPCLACELQSLFLAAFSRDGGQVPLQDPYDPLVPHRLLHAMWSHASGEHLAGYEQQDAHEFFIALLDAVSTDLRPYPPAPPPTAKRPLLDPKPPPSRSCPSSCSPPKCDLQAIFQGTLRSDVICSVCKHASTVYEPFNDLSLPLERTTTEPEHTPMAVVPQENGTAGPGGDAATAGGASTTHVVGTRSRLAAEDELTVAHCLESYTAAETLSEPYNCSKCGCGRLSSKQLTIQRLPEVLVLHLKRFDARRSRKIERFVRFPARGLDMSRYLYLSRSDAVSNARAAAVAAADDEGAMQVEGSADELASLAPTGPLPYDLFAMVEHRGASLQQGHYKASVREGDRWFTCNDTWVTLETEEDILSSQGYLLFYISRRSACPTGPEADQ